MRWLPSQVNSIVVNYAHDGVAYCPHDRTPLVAVQLEIPGSRHTVMIHRCPMCGNDTSSAVPTLAVGRNLTLRL
jgi:hypothetical protein